MARLSLVVLLALAVACGGDGGTDTDVDEGVDDAPAAGAVVRIQGFAYHDAKAAPGATLTVRNEDAVPHTLTADDKAFDTGTIDGGKDREMTAPGTPGSYKIHCEIHPSITGELVVS